MCDKVENSSFVLVYLFEQKDEFFFKVDILYYLTDRAKAGAKAAVLAKKRVRPCFKVNFKFCFSKKDKLLKRKIICNLIFYSKV